MQFDGAKNWALLLFLVVVLFSRHQQQASEEDLLSVYRVGREGNRNTLFDRFKRNMPIVTPVCFFFLSNRITVHGRNRSLVKRYANAIRSNEAVEEGGVCLP